MPLDLNRILRADFGDAPDERQHGRVRCGERFRARFGRSDFGRIVDLCGAGLRVERRALRSVRVGKELDLTLRYNDQSVEVIARVIWTRKQGFRRHLIGLELVNLTPELSQAITELTDVARYKFSIAERESADE
ncbi:MAG: PilZ domain-containing protein [Phycisphaeraceae bacterium]|nr:PilZ domain-containing protein [Phycisphaeraceae bacterium]